jgi:hypothetical protein
MHRGDIPRGGDGKILSVGGGGILAVASVLMVLVVVMVEVLMSALDGGTLMLAV